MSTGVSEERETPVVRKTKQQIIKPVLLLALCFYFEDGASVFVRNVCRLSGDCKGFYPDYTSLNEPRVHNIVHVHLQYTNLRDCFLLKFLFYVDVRLGLSP
jgi:hypothetical protein